MSTSTTTLPQKPTPMPVMPDNIPQDLKQVAQWIGWKWVPKDKKDGYTKPPFDLSGRHKVSKTDPQNHHEFEQALAAYDAGRLDGIGFCFMDDDPFAGIDLDDCRDPETGEIMEDAMAIINIADSYTEVSPSGRGVKIFLKGHHPNGNNATFISSPFNQTSANPKLT